MLAVHLSALTSPTGADEALALVDGFDAALEHGLGRLSPEHAAALGALAGAVAATPLGAVAAEAADKLAAGAASDSRLLALAGARAAVLGAVHDALLDGFDTALGRTRAPWTPTGETPPSAPSPSGSSPSVPLPSASSPSAPSPVNLLAGCRSWLGELAITGWRGVGHDLVAAADPTIEALLAVPSLRRLAVLVDGLAAELRASSPVATMEHLPVRRWADLWSRAMLLTEPQPAQAGEPVSGRLLLLGVDVHEHGTAVQIQAHGLLETSGETRLVRTSLAAAKVDTIVGAAVWRLFSAYPVLLSALAKRLTLDITGMTLLPSGDLLWNDDQARGGELANPFTVARVQLATGVAPAVPPLERHPVRLAEPVLIEGYSSDGTTVELDGHTLVVERLSGCGPLTPDLVAASTACLGLLRWDGGRWRLQPLAVQATVKRKPVEAHSGDWAEGITDPKLAKAEARHGDAVAVLKERAGRLLRK
ncbi:hypothetical protein [Nonomuraea soli]|uniref:Uncharacterized protein n=1 Tax=Nonomuraea soli TaxID=1032476 RepID=A0A7W0CGZ9_9ACTN|nr:hypothetical protein [Nonomuraea soli]MBA2891000.1 hypothetical protein [Nonomuraea soli]